MQPKNRSKLVGGNISFQLVNEADNAALGGIALSLLSVPHCGLLNR